MSNKLSKIIFFVVFLVSLISIVTIEVFHTTYEYAQYKQNLKKLENEFISTNEQNLKFEVQKAISLIKFNYDKKDKLINKSVKQRIQEAYSLAKSLYEKYKNEKTKEEILKIIKDSLRSIKFYDGYGYYSIYDFTGKTIMHGANKDYENSYALKQYKDENNKAILNGIISLAKTKNEDYINWRFLDPVSKIEDTKKGYFKVFEPYNLIFLVADYASRIENELKNEALERVKKIEYSKDGYIFILDIKGNILVNKHSKYEGRNFSNIENPREKELVRKILNKIENKNETFIKYSWINPNTLQYSDKLTYLAKFEKWGWFIGTGIYLDSMYEKLDNEKQKLKDETFYRIFYSLCVFFVIFCFIFYITRKITKEMNENFLLFLDFFKKANSSNKKIDIDNIKFYEFKQLAINANKMIDSKISNEEKLKAKNKEALINLSLLNEYKKAVDASAIVSKTNIEGIITFANKKFCKVSGFTKDELIGAKHNLVRHPDTKKEIYKELWTTILNKRVWKGVLKNKTKKGKTYYVKSTIVPILDLNSNITEFIAIRYDISDLINQEKRIRLQTTDILTNLPNRQKLLEDLNAKKDLILGVFNILRFKEVNEYYGFEVGDKLLLGVAQKLRSLLKDNKLFLYKLQGDEFAILVNKNIFSLKEFKIKCENIINSIKQIKFEIEENILEVNLVAGISAEKNYFINAEMAKNHAKIENKDIIIFDENREIKSNLIENINWTQKLKKALNEDRIVVFIQAIISNETQEIEKYECLVRMIDEDGTIISPFKFLNIAKKSKLYNALTQKVIKKAFDYFANKDIEFSINLSLEDILHKPTIDFLEEKLKENRNAAQRLIVEIVEEEGIENYQEICDFIENLKSYGCKIAIDDFGTGYSNFEYLMKLNVDIVKIDGSMIKYINQDLNAKIVTELIVTFAKRLNIKTVAEFVHSQEINEIVTDMGIDFSQGFYLGVPKPIK
ncbi:PAS domain S-box-containing protein/diguanylate cyclase (GGDEF)-like protein [Malaciobacter marinus]|uniref:PAS domain S-box-containing protein/diguanylate cyclase (GGDEF)-like protein n=1 Tax=Malaciobacter marinus TaxID=505249 RepID=A0AB36ZZN6_9BACT|nr:cache domain-containing protein [Malaciobacter marinus]PPK62941.1 PAS domain S-box-containing protein/diguanylate cyclase (GGDEF)-like protein [Malaciobacter marinus]